MADLKKLALGRKAFAKVKDAAGKAAGGKAGKADKTLEESSREEIGEAEQAFRNRLDREDKRRRMATDSEFWFAVYFQSREEKEAFLRRHGLDRIGDKYLPGSAVERALQNRSVNRDGHRR